MNHPLSPPGPIIPKPAKASYKAETAYVCPDNLDDMLDDAGGSDRQKQAFKAIVVETQSFEEGDSPTTLDDASTLYAYFCDGWRAAEEAHGIKEKD